MQIREASLDDHGGLMALFARHGMATVSEPRWRARWMANPAYRAEVPVGWVLESEGGIAGHIGNLPRLMWDGTRELVAQVPTSWAVDPPARAYSMSLLTRWLRQPNTELLLNTTANAEAAALFDRLGIARVPVPGLDRTLVWLLDHATVARALLRARGWGGASFLAGASAPFDALRHARSGDGSTLEWRREFHVGFDRLWGRLRDRQVLQSVRDARHLRWMYGEALATGDAWLLVDGPPDEPRGYAVFRRCEIVTLGIPRLEWVDFAALDDDPRPFLDAVVKRARAESIPWLETSGFHGTVFERLAHRRPWRRQRASWPRFWRTPSAPFEARLRSASAWYTSLFDGDCSLG